MRTQIRTGGRGEQIRHIPTVSSAAARAQAAHDLRNTAPRRLTSSVPRSRRRTYGGGVTDNVSPPTRPERAAAGADAATGSGASAGPVRVLPADGRAATGAAARSPPAGHVPELSERSAPRPRERPLGIRLAAERRLPSRRVPSRLSPAWRPPPRPRSPRCCAFSRQHLPRRVRRARRHPGPAHPGSGPAVRLQLPHSSRSVVEGRDQHRRRDRSDAGLLAGPEPDRRRRRHDPGDAGCPGPHRGHHRDDPGDPRGDEPQPRRRRLAWRCSRTAGSTV